LHLQHQCRQQIKVFVLWRETESQITSRGANARKCRGDPL
jgi:hypothetical protein